MKNRSDPIDSFLEGYYYDFKKNFIFPFAFNSCVSVFVRQ